VVAYTAEVAKQVGPYGEDYEEEEDV